MPEKEYLTLKEISEEIKVNYKTLISCKHRLKNFVQGYAVGRTAKYDPDLLDFFKMVFALLDEGYQTDEIIKLLNNGVTSDNELFIKEWLDTWRDKLGITNGNNGTISKEDEGMTD